MPEMDHTMVKSQGFLAPPASQRMRQINKDMIFTRYDPKIQDHLSEFLEKQFYFSEATPSPF